MPIVWGQKVSPVTLQLYARHADAIADLPMKERLRITVDRDRNGKFSALYHVMLGLLAKAINSGPASTDIDQLKKWVKLKRGWYDVIELPKPVNGVSHVIEYRSTAFAKMGEGEFQRFAVETCDLIRSDLAPWIGSAPEYSEIMTLVESIAPEEVS